MVSLLIAVVGLFWGDLFGISFATVVSFTRSGLVLHGLRGRAAD